VLWVCSWKEVLVLELGEIGDSVCLWVCSAVRISQLLVEEVVEMESERSVRIWGCSWVDDMLGLIIMIRI